MKREQLHDLLNKYYQGETDLSQEARLKNEIAGQANEFPEESELFSFFDQEAVMPEDLEKNILNRIEVKEGNKKRQKVWFIRLAPTAALFLIFFSIFLLKPKEAPVKELTEEEQFMILEQALAQVSYSIQPEDDDDLLVVFQDENFEIVMN